MVLSRPVVTQNQASTVSDHSCSVQCCGAYSILSVRECRLCPPWSPHAHRVHHDEAHLLVQGVVSTIQLSINDDVQSDHEQQTYTTFDLGLMPSLTHSLFHSLAHPLTVPFTCSPTHSLIYSLHAFVCRVSHCAKICFSLCTDTGGLYVAVILRPL